MMSPLSEADRFLLGRIRHGDADGWSQLVDRYQGRLMAFALDRLGQAAEAEDAVQETFLGFLKGLARFREDASLETYLFGILRRKIVDAYRGRNLNVCALQDRLPGDGDDRSAERGRLIAASDPTASWYVRRDEDQQLLRSALAAALHDVIGRLRKSLDLRSLQVAELVFYAQLRNKDIAAQTGVDEKQVALIKHRFLKRISGRTGRYLRDVASSGSAADESTRDQVLAQNALLTEVWEEQRPSCPKRSTIGAYLLHTLDTLWHGYVDFHLNKLGCRFCRANLQDVQQQTGQNEPRVMRDRIMQSTVGFLQRS